MTALKIGFSACFLPADPKRDLFKGKRLLYMVEDMCDWFMEAGALPVLLPRARGRFSFEELVNQIDGLLLQGGSDVCPKSYGEDAIRPEWNGDYDRDQYEIELIHEAMRQDKPILGVCRGNQILNVAFGGTLYQDIKEQRTESEHHRNWDVYDMHQHGIKLSPDSWLSHVYQGRTSGVVNSIHHQAIKELSEKLEADAFSERDSIIEAVHLKDAHADGRYVRAVQWHPEFQKEGDGTCLGPAPILNDFFHAIEKRA